eukprot:5204331-Amphidinium_carterae.1
MVIFRDAVVEERASQHKQDVLALLVHSCPCPVRKSLLLQAALTGDWRNEQEIEIYVRAGEPLPSLPKTRKTLATLLIGTLCSAQPPVFPRSRWTGALEAICYFCLLFGCHSLFPGAYKRFLEKVSGSKSGKKAAKMNSSHPASGETIANLGLPELEHAVVDGGTNEMAVLPSESAELTHPPLGNEMDPNYMAALNAKCRRSAWEWVESSPFPKLLIFMQLLVPLTQLLRKQLQTTGEDWELEQRCHVANAMLSGADPRKTRDFQATLAASGAVEGRTLEYLHSLMCYGSTWDGIIPEHARTNETKLLIHRLISRASALIHVLLQRPHRSFPLAMFSLIHHPERAAELRQCPDCVKDKWTVELQQSYPTFQEPELVDVLISEAQTMHTDIAGIEARHASVRRQLHFRSLQTHPCGLKGASAQWIFQCARKLDGKVAKKSKCAFQGKRQRHRKHAKGGGSWRAYQRLFSSKDGLTDNKALSAAYHQLKRDGGQTWELVQRLGEAGKGVVKEHRKTSAKKCFGLTSKELNKKRALHRKVAVCSRLLTEPVALQVQSIMKEQVSLADGIQLSNALSAQEHHQTTLQKEGQSKTLQQWQDTFGRHQLSSMYQRFPHLQSHDFEAIPSAGLWTFQHRSKAIDKATTCVAWSMEQDHPIGQQLSNAWERHHYMVRAHEDRPNPAAEKERKPCLDAGFCICGEDSRFLRRLEKAFIVDLKKTFHLRDARQVLGSGRIVVCFSSDAKDAVQGTQEVARELLFSIPLMYWTPYRPTLQSLARASSADEWLCNVAGSFHIQALGSFCGTFEALKQLDLSRAWFKQYFCMSDHTTPVASLCPRVMAVEEFSSKEQLRPIIPKARSHTMVHAWALFAVQHAEDERMDIDDASSDVYDADASGSDDDMSTSHASGDEGAADAEGDCEWLDQLVEHMSNQEATQLVHGVAEPSNPSHPSEESLARDAGGRLFLGRLEAAASCIIPNRGKISWYHSKQGFEAHCFKHAGCTLSKSTVRSMKCTGRPLGLIASWLYLDCCAEDHKSRPYLRGVLDEDCRKAGRAALKDIPSSGPLFTFEHPRGADEPDEPATLKGLL